MKSTVPHFCAALLASFFFAAVPVAHAALGGASGIVIPYAGKLELNGALVTGSVDFEFGVAPGAGLPVPTSPVNCVFTIRDVPVTNGEFAVSIPITVAKESCVKGNDVHLVVRVARTGEALVLLGTQRVTPVVAAATSGPGDFAVTGALTANTAAVTGALTASSAALTGAVTAKSLVVSDPQSSFVAEFNSGTRGLAIGSDTIKATGSAAGQGIILVPKIGGIVEVTGPLQADQGATVAGTLGVGYVAGTCRSYGSLGGIGLGFCACSAGTVVLGGAADCGNQGGVKGTQMTSQAVPLGAFGTLPAQAYAAACNNGLAPDSVQVVCARLGP